MEELYCNQRRFFSNVKPEAEKRDRSLYSGGATEEVLQELGITSTYGSPKGTFLLHEGQMYPFPASTSSLVSSHLLTFGDKVELARLFSTLPRLKAASLAYVSVQVFVKKLQRSLKHPVLYIDGGWQILIDGLRQAAEQAGARIMSSTRVASVAYQNGQVQGVR